MAMVGCLGGVREASALPRRLVLALDGIAYRDMQALQAGVGFRDARGRRVSRRAFHQGYYPVSRLISSYPSTSDVAWTEVFGCRPLPGYQRTYFSRAANAEVQNNGVTSSVEYERQMNWRAEGGVRRALAYVHCQRAFRRDLDELVEAVLGCTSPEETYYALVLSSDDAQHMGEDVFGLLELLDAKLGELRARYRARAGRELEVLILSDHGNNHAGPGERVAIRPWLEQAGYHPAQSIRQPKDVVLPTAGIESWVELHNSPGETEALLERLSHLPGVDVLTARSPEQATRFLVVNARGERAEIDWKPAEEAYRYTPVRGDPLEYQSAAESLGRQGALDAAGFGSAEAWLAATMAHRYPLALERIARAHTRGTLNPATILISLDNRFVHARWLVKKASQFKRLGGTHGGLDDLNSTGILLSSFAPTHDTSVSRVAALYGGFKGWGDYRAHESSGEWVTARGQALTAIARGPIDWSRGCLPDRGVFLRVWSPRFRQPSAGAEVELVLRKSRLYVPARVRRGDPVPAVPVERRLTLSSALPVGGREAYERVYALPSDVRLEPGRQYQVEVRQGEVLCEFTFDVDAAGRPVAY